jgi:hypothetical protein
VDPFSLLMLAQGAVSAIRSGCEMLREGKAVIDELKGDAEGVVSEVKATVEELQGLWQWAVDLWDQLKGLLGASAKPDGSTSTKPTEAAKPAVGVAVPAVASPKPVAKKKKQPQRELTYEEYKARAIHDVCENLKVFFDIQRQLKEHCRELEEQSKTTDRVADAAIDRIEIETQLVDLSKQIKDAMIYTPEELGLQALYSRFLEMYDLILEEQEFDRQLKRKRERDAKWQRELQRNHRIDRTVVAVTVLLMVLWMWGFLLSLGWLARTHDGSLWA